MRRCIKPKNILSNMHDNSKNFEDPVIHNKKKIK